MERFPKALESRIMSPAQAAKLIKTGMVFVFFS